MGDEGSYGKSPRPRSVGGLFLMLLAHPIRSSSPPARDVADVEEPEEVASHLPGAASVANFRTKNSAVQMGQLIMHSIRITLSHARRSGAERRIPKRFRQSD